MQLYHWAWACRFAGGWASSLHLGLCSAIVCERVGGSGCASVARGAGWRGTMK
jgi:hypothetical protein